MLTLSSPSLLFSSAIFLGLGEAANAFIGPFLRHSGAVGAGRRYLRPRGQR